MRWDELQGDEWILTANRTKQKKENVLPLSADALAVIAELPRVGPFVFSRGRRTSRPATNEHDESRPIAVGKTKVILDTLMLAEMRRVDPEARLERWTLHDVRRGGRTLLARIGVDRDVAEAVLGHKRLGVEGVYNQHQYIVEKRRALELLAAEVRRILEPHDGERVVPIRRKVGEP